MIARKISLLLLALAALATQASRADTYRTINPPQPVTSGARIEVIEFFYYTCSDCSALLALEESWIRQLPQDVVFRRIAVAWNQSLVAPAQAYAALVTLGEEARLHDKIFQAIHVLHVPLNTAPEWTDWVTKNGVDRNRWTSVYASPAVASRGQASITAGKPYGADRAPSFAVDGKYYTDLHVALGIDSLAASGQMNGAKLLHVVDQLIVKARADRAAKKP